MGHSFSITAESLVPLVGGLASREEALLRQMLTLFPIPRPELVAQLMSAIRRVGETVRWFENASGFPGIKDVAATIEARLDAKFGSLERSVVTDRLTGSSYLLTRSLIGKEPQPMPGPEALRAVLLACGMHWQVEGKRRRNSMEQLGVAVRQITEHNLRPSGRRSSLLPHLKALGEPDILTDFITASRVLVENGNEAFRYAWKKDFLPTLQAIADADPPQATSLSPPSPPRPRPPVARDPNEEDEKNDDRLARAIRRIVSRPVGGSYDQLPGEPADETATCEVVSAIPLVRKGADARKLAHYLASQNIWGSNYLQLTSHPDVLPLHRYRRVVRTLIDEIRQQVETADLTLGLVGLLLQAITGRTQKTLAAIQLQESSLGDRQVGACGLSLDHGYLELDVFWHLRPKDAKKGDATGYFEPDPSEVRYFEPVDTRFRLPLHREITEVLRPKAALIPKLVAMEEGRRDECLRLAARHVRGKIGGPLALGNVRRSFAAHLYEGCRDTALTQLIAADTLGQSDASLHYYSPRESAVARAYWSFLNHLLREDIESAVGADSSLEASPRAEDVDPPLPKAFESNRRVGAAGLLVDMWARRLASTSASYLNVGIAKLMEQGGWRGVHEALVTHLACMLMVVAGHRPVDALFQLTMGDIHMDVDGGSALFRDKINDGAHDPRLAVLAPCLVKQIQSYLAHLHGLAGISKELAAHVRQVLEGRAPLLFGVDGKGAVVPLTISTLRPSLPAEWRDVRLNWGRTWIRTRAIELGLSPEFASIQLGHLETVGYPFSNASPTVPKASIAMIAPYLEKMARRMGWRVRAGIPHSCTSTKEYELLPLQDWTGAISVHEAKAKEAARQWRQVQIAKIATFRERAVQDVLAHPILVERGISEVVQGDPDSEQVRPLTRDEAEALRDVLFEQAGDDPALGIATSWALRKILSRVNKRLGIQGQDPAPLGVFRRQVDNAFVPGMMAAVRQIEALRAHAEKLGSEPPGDWKDLPRAFARVAYCMVVFGFMEDPVQIMGVLENRDKCVAPANLPDTILVPWGERPNKVVALRNIAALSLARLAKRYPRVLVPERAELGEALLGFLPAWALPTSDCKVKDALALLCGTVSLVNRYELSPAARYESDPEMGSTPAIMDEQLALIDGDPVGTLVRAVNDQPAEETSPVEILPKSKGTASARTQYLALLAALPKSGKHLELPLTGVTVPAHLLVGESTRNKVIAELDAMLAEDRSNRVLQPVVRLLTLWVRQMLVEGTPNKKDPSDRTVGTYLTRIGATLVEWLGSGSLVDVDEVELEEAYIAAILVGDTNRSQAASAILQFHRCAQRHYAMPEVDLTQVMWYLRDASHPSDARLILPQERAEIFKRAAARADVGSPDSNKEQGRIFRQAAAVLPLYAWGGLRRSEALGLRVGDAWDDDEYVSVRVRRNRSRRIKTRAAARIVSFDRKRRQEIYQFEEWAFTDSLRQQAWRRERAYIFSPLSSPQSPEGRDDIAQACARVAKEVTGRPSERLHRFRHLVAFELITPMFLAETDANWLKDLELNDQGQQWSDVLLPRDLLGKVVMLGHSDWRVTLRCYYHMNWLLKSRQDAATAERYMHRRVVAFATGLTLPAVDKIVQQALDKEPRRSWFDHFRDVRVAPLRVRSESAMHDGSTRRWTVHELDALFKLAGSMKSLDRAIRSSGGGPEDERQIRRNLQVAERRLGRKLFHEAPVKPSSYKRQRVVRELDGDLKRLLLEWMGSDEGDGASVMRDLVESMSPTDAGVIAGPVETIQSLECWLEQIPGIECIQCDAMDGMAALKVSKAVARPSHENRSGKNDAGLMLVLTIKRAALVAWISDRLS